MRHMLVLLIPAMWGFMWLFIRLLMNQRAAPPPHRRDEPVIEVNWRDPQDYRPSDEPQGPLCGRHNLHLFMRLVGTERACRHCAEVRHEQDIKEREDAIREAERHIHPGGPADNGAARS
jgi:hypothetical protein